MKFYSFETMFSSLKEELAAFLKMEEIYYECSGAFGGYHFEIKCSPSDVEKINAWLDENTITEEA